MAMRFQSGYPKRIDIADGTVYPILRKLKSDGLVTTYLQEEAEDRRASTILLRRKGWKPIKATRAEYLDFARAVKELLEDEEK